MAKRKVLNLKNLVIKQREYKIQDVKEFTRLEKQKKQKKITFSEEIDSSIGGLALGTTFVIMAVLVWKLEIFHNVIVDRIIEVVLILIGILGTLIELGKLNKGDIKGIDDLTIGVIVTSVPLFFVWKFDKLIVNIICFLILIIGVFGFFSGVIKIIYSLILVRRKTVNKKVKIINGITLITEVVALAVVVLQLAVEIKK